METFNLYILGPSKHPSRIYSKRFTPRHIIIKLSKDEDEKRTCKQQERSILLCTRDQQKDQQPLSHQKPFRTQASRMAYSNTNNKPKQNNLPTKNSISSENIFKNE